MKDASSKKIDSFLSSKGAKIQNKTFRNPIDFISVMRVFETRGHILYFDLIVKEITVDENIL